MFGRKKGQDVKKAKDSAMNEMSDCSTKNCSSKSCSNSKNCK